VASELRKVLMAARRDVGKALRSGESPAAARDEGAGGPLARLQLGKMKVAAGQRWEAGLRASRSPL
jgi:hypothetical protein